MSINYIVVRTNPEYRFDDVLHSINHNFSAITTEFLALTGGTITGDLFVDGSITATTYYGDGSNLSGVSSANYYTTGATLVGTTAFFDRNDTLSAYTLQLSGLTSGITISGDFLPLSGGTMTGNILISGGTFINALSGGSRIDLRYADINGATLISSNSGLTNQSFLYVDPTSFAIQGNGASSILTNGDLQIITNNGDITITSSATTATGDVTIQGGLSGTTGYFQNVVDVDGQLLVNNSTSNASFAQTINNANFPYGIGITKDGINTSNGILFRANILAQTGIAGEFGDIVANNSTTGLRFFTNSIEALHMNSQNDGGYIGIGTNLTTALDRLHISGGTIRINTLNSTEGAGKLAVSDVNGSLSFSSITQLGISTGSSITGAFLNLSGGTVTGDTIFTTLLSANTLSLGVWTGFSDSAQTVDWSVSSNFEYELTGNTTFSFANQSNGQTIVMAVKQTTAGTGGTFYTVAWPSTATTKWQNSVTPSQTSGATTDVYTFIHLNGINYSTYIQNFIL